MISKVLFGLLKYGLPAFAVVALTGPFIIKRLQALKASQTERQYLESHVAKQGTPTMGGIMILLGFLVASIIPELIIRLTTGSGMVVDPHVIPVLILTLGFGFIGFLDDYLKVVLRRPDGLIAWQKFLLQIAVTTAFLVYLINLPGYSFDLRIPFAGINVDIGFLAYPLLYFAVIGTVNGTNFTDGLDGLASSVTIVVALFFSFAALCLSNTCSIAGFAMTGALCGFLLFNHYPAKVFMGDTGSLALGGFVAGMAYMMNMPIYIIIVGIIYLVEVLSVMIQVSYFKMTGGKRIFRMAPIHHHFEKGGWSEVKIVLVFTGITLAMSLLIIVCEFI